MSAFGRRPWGQQKPPLGFGIDWSHPLVGNLTGCWLFNEQSGQLVNDLANTANKALALGGLSWSPNVLRNSGLGSGLYQIPDTRQKSTDLTFIWKGRIVGGTPWNSPIFGCSTPRTSYTAPYRAFALQQGLNSPSNLTITYNVNGTFKNVAWSNSIAINIPATYACTFGLNSVIGYKNGKYAVSGTDRASAPSYGTNPGLLWCSGIATNGYTLECEHEYTFLFDIPLSADEIASLYAEPYQMIEGWNYGRVYSIPSSTGIILSPFWYHNSTLEAI